MKTLLKLLLFVMLVIPSQLKAQNAIAIAIKQHRAILHYPLSVERFYKREGFKPVWLLPDSSKTPVWDAMSLLDCVLQYGLTEADYHPLGISYRNLNALQISKAGNSEKADFDILVTDAMITLVNNLHYGKLNPIFSHSRIDAEDITQFKADRVLANALEWNGLMAMISSIQPQSEAYINLQRHMLLLTTKYAGNNYIRPESDIRKMAINMERLRWIYTTGRYFHLTYIVREGVIIKFKKIYHEVKDQQSSCRTNNKSLNGIVH